ncbi:hypothetical protein [Methylocaldum sp.]|uniref:hypothetical protein n=1 Tax=Methylocaldum sp. TaxID=1969727 RepID=UPI002D24F2ED|nr:hypothetical protein [Methylocaldum sp.]HYE35314.1 hypothetical protein [Methylocaldum sp.]
MKKGLAGALCLLVNCFLSTGYASGLDEEVAFASESSKAVATEDLDEERGREGVDDLAFAHGALKATLANNEAISSNSTTYNVIDGGAFTDAGGIISVIQNTGNNVIIQDSTVVNVTILP